MLASIKLNNYKSLNMDKNLSLAGLTIFSGKNNVGKSATIQAILDLAQYNHATGIHNINGSAEPLMPNYYRKVHNNICENDITIESKIIINETTHDICYKFSYDEKSRAGYVSYFKITSINSEKKRYLEIKKNKLKSFYDVEADSILEPMFMKLKNMEGELPSKFQGTAAVIFVGFIPIRISFTFKNNDSLDQWFKNEKENDEVVFSLPFPQDLIKHFSSIQYIGPMRSLPKEYYLLGERTSNVSGDGSDTIDTLDLSKEQLVSYYANTKDTKLTKVPLLEAVQYWIHYFTEAEFELNEITDNLVQVLVNGHPMNHSGFGIGQLLPIIVQSLLMQKGSILFLEQPEIHLHPALEMKLAVFLLCMVKNKKQIVAEIHSEHLINQLTLEKLENAEYDEIIKIYFFNKDKGEDNVSIEEINIDKRGTIKNWPKGFFDQYLDFTKVLIGIRKELAIENIKKKNDKN